MFHWMLLDGLVGRWDSIKGITNIPKNEFINAVKFVLTSTYFTFNRNVYKQIFGTPIGSLLFPIISDIVIKEERVLNSLQFRVSAYFRYVDDVFTIASKDKVAQILNLFNDQHDRLKFTIEYEENHCLNFFDLSIIVRERTRARALIVKFLK